MTSEFKDGRFVIPLSSGGYVMEIDPVTRQSTGKLKEFVLVEERFRPKPIYINGVLKYTIRPYAY